MRSEDYQICITYLLSCHSSTAGGGMKESCAGSQERLQTVSAGPGTGAGGTAPFWRHELRRQGAHQYSAILLLPPPGAGGDTSL